jgi:hypothetical protein
VISGCSTTSQLTSPVDAHRKVGEGNATVNLRSGASLEGQEFHFGRDSTRFSIRSNDSLVWALNKDIESVGVTHRVGGILEGLLFGGLGGGAVGFIAGSGMGSGGDQGMGKGLLALAGIFVGGVGGAVVGAIKGHDYTFIFPKDSLRVDSQTSEKRGINR